VLKLASIYFTYIEHNSLRITYILTGKRTTLPAEGNRLESLFQQFVVNLQAAET
jgi:hypothetical protein